MTYSDLNHAANNPIKPMPKRSTEFAYMVLGFAILAVVAVLVFMFCLWFVTLLGYTLIALANTLCIMVGLINLICKLTE